MIINIAICDDEHQQTEYMKTLVGKWAGENNIGIAVDMFESAEKFKNALNNSKEYDILLLDIQMGGQNGIELARELRETDDKLTIIFITALIDFIEDGYEVSALHYLVKPVKENKLFTALDKAYKNMTREKKFLIVNFENKNCRILFEDILYIEAFRHYVTIAAADGTQYIARQNISQTEQQLDNSFFRCQRSYIVMLGHIKYISKSEVLLDNGKTIPLSRNIYNDLYRAFIRYFKGKGEDAL